MIEQPKRIRSAADAVSALLATASAPSAQEAQHYQEKPQHPRCMDCKHLRSKRFERTSYFSGPYVDHRNMHCGLGGFKVTKMAVCDCFERAPA